MYLRVTDSGNLPCNNYDYNYYRIDYLLQVDISCFSTF